jgi:hypothetical protein
MDTNSNKISDPNSKSLYLVGGVAALIIVVMYLLALIIYIPPTLAGPPENVIEWFTLFQEDPIVGLFFLGFADIIIVISTGPMFLALYTALNEVNKTWSLIATSFAFVGIAVYLATNTAFSMLALSHQFAITTTAADKSLLLAAGESILAMSEGTGGRYMSLPLIWLCILIISLVMQRSKSFSKLTAWAGIVGFPLLIAGTPFAGYTTTGPSTPIVSLIIAISYLGGGLLSLLWYILVGLRLIKLGRSG